MIILKLVKIFYRIIFVTSLLFLLHLFGHTSVYASVLFQDNFNSGNDNQWTRLSGENIWKVENGMYGGRIEDSNTIIDSVAGNIDWTDYVFELDIFPITGSDKNIRFRWRPERGFCNQFHFGENNVTSDGGPTVSYSLPINQISHIKVILNGSHHILFVNDQKIVDTTQSNSCPTGSIGLTISTGASFPTEVWFDNVKVSTIDPDPLNVPLWKQTADPWASQLYDSANIWSPSDTSVSSWGCALTSAAMVLKYHGINRIPDDVNLDPGTLNQWLKRQPDGYVRNGQLNWIALSRLTRITREHDDNPDVQFDALEFSRGSGNDKLQLIEDLNNFRPDILEEPGHFIVAKGIQDDTFQINDPYYNRSLLTDGYNNSFNSLIRFVPSNTNLSYIMLEVDKNINVALTDSNNHPLGSQIIEKPITNPITSALSGEELKTVYLPKPQAGIYKVTLKSENPSFYHLDTYLYDEDGNVTVINKSGPVGNNTGDSFLIDFTNTQNPSSSKIVSFDSIIQDINEYAALKQIDKGVANALTTLLKNAQKDAKNGKNKIAKLQLDVVKVIVKQSKPKIINPNAQQSLLDDLQTLYNSF